MICLFYNIEKFFDRGIHTRFNTFIWYILKYVLNSVLPIYYRIVPRKKGIPTSYIVNRQVIVSLTTFPERMKRLPLVLESIFRQTVAADKIILWLADSQFPDKEYVNCYFKRYIQLGLEIKYCDDLKAHKKYYYSMKQYPEALIVTFDDDVLCPEDVLEKLLITYKSYPNCIVTQRAHKMLFNKDGQLKPYNEWNKLAKGCQGPDKYLLATGGAGCLYFPESLSEHVFDDDQIKKLCLYADYIWLKCMAFIKGTPIVLTGKNNPEIIDVLENKKNGLAKKNVEKNMNDEQLKAVSEYYGIKWDK